MAQNDIAAHSGGEARSAQPLEAAAFRARLLELADEYEKLEATLRTAPRLPQQDSPVPCADDGADRRSEPLQSEEEWARPSVISSQPLLAEDSGRDQEEKEEDDGDAVTAAAPGSRACAEAQVTRIVSGFFTSESCSNSRGSVRGISSEIMSLDRERVTERVRQWFHEEPARIYGRPGNGRQLRHRKTYFHNPDEPLLATDLHVDRLNCCCHEALDPNSQARLLLECITLLICLHDIITVPVVLAWDPEPTFATRVLNITFLLFWVTEMVLNFFTGFYRDGMLVTDLRQVSLHYLRTMFVIDCFTNSVDMAAVAVEFGLQEQMRESTVLRVLRLGRLNRLARVVIITSRLMHKFRLAGFGLSSLTMFGLAARLIAVLFLLNHVICCGWYWVGQSQWSDTESSWLDTATTSGSVTYRSTDPIFQYMTALHWAFTQMTPGSMSVVPQNSVERGWTIICLIIGLFASSLLISQLSAKMVRIQSLNAERLQQADLLSRFLSEQGVNSSLSQRIRRQVRERASMVKPLSMMDLPSLSCLPLNLKEELHSAIYARTLLMNPVFYAWTTTDETLVEELATSCVHSQVHSIYDDVFVPKQEARFLFFLRTGILAYSLTTPQSLDEGRGKDGIEEVPQASLSRDLSVKAKSSHGSTIQIKPSRSMSSTMVDAVEDFPTASHDKYLHPKAWASTIAMWCKWAYLGRLQAQMPCEMVAFDCEVIAEKLHWRPGLYQMNHAYAHAYSALSLQPEHVDHVDLDITSSQVLMAMSTEDSVLFSEPTLNSFGEHRPMIDQYFPVRRHRIQRQEKLRLREEIRDGKCVIGLGEDGQLLRTVLLCVLHIKNFKGEQLMRIATTKSDILVPDCVLPGSKLRGLETAQQAAERLIHDELPKLVGTCMIEDISEETTTSVSKLGITSAYLKTKFSMLFEEADETGGRRAPSQLFSDGLPSIPTLHALEFLRPDGRLELYAWLSKQSLEALQSHALDKEFKQWLAAYDERRKQMEIEAFSPAEEESAAEPSSVGCACGKAAAPAGSEVHTEWV